MGNKIISITAVPGSALSGTVCMQEDARGHTLCTNKSMASCRNHGRAKSLGTKSYTLRIKRGPD